MVRPVGALIAALFLLGACSEADKEQVDVEQRNEWPVFRFAHVPLVMDIVAPTEPQLAAAREADAPFDAWFFTATAAPPGSASTVGEIRITDFIVGPDSYQEFEYVVPNAANPDQEDASIAETESGACDAAGVEAEAIEIRSTQSGCVLTATGAVVWFEHNRTFIAKTSKSAEVSTSAVVAWLDSLVVTQIGQTGAPYEMPFCSDDPSGCTS